MRSTLITLILSILILAGIWSNTAETVAREHKSTLFPSSSLDLLSQEERVTFLQFLSKNKGAHQFIDGFALEPASYLLEGVISGVVFHDLNENGEMEEGEDGISGVKITLKKLSFYWFWLYFKKVGLTTTGEDGFYQFEQLTPGIYLLIEEDLPECTSITSNIEFVFIGPAYEEWEINFGDYCEGEPPECTYYHDGDGDGYGNPDESDQYPCGEQPPSWMENNTDCDDTNPGINPDATEICDGLDNDCDEDIDEGLGTTTCGLGVCEHTVADCMEGVPQVCNPFEGAGDEVCDGLDNDCDGETDEDLGTITCGVGECKQTINNCVDGKPQECIPGDPIPEVCDGLDNDCDEVIDEGVLNTYYQDADGDGYGNFADSVQECEVPAGYVENSNDCDDTNGKINPAVAEDCTDGVDNDCNGLADGDDPICQPVCTDADVDGFSIEGGVCGPVDCDDSDNTIYPGAPDACEDGIDQDCDGKDLLCILEDPDGDLWAESQGDCCETGEEDSLGCGPETRSTIFPGATDFPGDGIDQDCDGEDDPVPSMEDFDGDGVTFADGDCNDCIPTVYPGATEIICNGIDEDCDGTDTCGITPTEEPDSGYITGEVFDADTRLPLPGAMIMVHGIGELFTDGEGKFAFPVPETRVYRLTMEKTGYTYGQKFIHVEKPFAFAADPFYLKPLDPASTLVTSGGGTHVNSTGEVIVEFPPGAVTDDITVSATRYEFGDSLPAPLPKTSHFTTAVKLLPDGVTFETPVRILVENSYNFPPGTPVPVGFYRKDLGIWVPDGMGIITPDGQYMEYWIKHFSSIDLNYSAAAPSGAGSGGEDTTQKNKPCNQAGDTDKSKVVFKNGEFMEDYYLPSFKSLGKTISHRLVYRSFAADPKAFITTRYELDSSETTIPETTEFTVKMAGTKKSVHFAGSEGNLKQSYLFDGVDYKGERLQTSIYPYEIALTNWYPAYYYGAHYFGWAGGGLIVPPIRADENVSFSKSFSGRLVFESLEDSSCGAGWSLAGIPRLILEESGRVLMTEGSGSSKVFTPVIITTVAGTGVNFPYDVEVDGIGNLYIADTNNGRIRKVGIDGVVTTVKSGTGSTMDVALDHLGNFYYPYYWYSGGYHSLVRKVDTNGITTIVAGGGDGLGDGGPATEARLVSVSDVAVDAKGNIYIADSARNTIRKVDTNGIITTVAGGYLNYPTGVAVDNEGNVYIADQDNFRVRKVNANGTITTVAGTGYGGDTGDGGPATQARIIPEELTLGAKGNLYISTRDSQVVRKVDTEGIITRVAGGGNPPDGLGDGGPATEASFDSPHGIAVDSVGNLYVADTSHNRIRRVFLGNPIDEVEYESPRGDYSTLVRNPDGTFTHTLKNKTVNQFDAEGYLTSTTDTNGNTTSYNYEEGNLVKTTYPTGQETNLYYTDGFLDYIEDPAGRQTTFVHDANGDLREITDPENHTLYFEYTGNHLLNKKTDRNNNVTWYHYDANGLIEQVVAEREGDDEITNYEPSDAEGLINDIPEGRGTQDNPADPVFMEDSTYTDPNGEEYTVETDMYGKALKIIDPLDNVTEYERGCDCGAPTRIVKPNGAEIIMEYDDMGNLITRTEQIDELESATYTYEYHPTFNKVTRITDPENNETDFEYDASGNLIKTINALDNETVFSYDSKGLLVSVTDALDHVSTDTYDTVGNIESSSDPLGNTTSYEYDLAGNVTKVADAEVNFTTYTYDLMNRIESVTDDLNNTTSYTYDGNGNMLTVTDAENNTTTYEYDAKGRKTLITDAENSQTNLAYDTNGNLITVTDANGNTTTYIYDEVNRLTQKIYHDGEIYIYTYDEVGNKITETDPNGNTTTFGYDLASRLITKTYPDTSTESYAYDVMGRVLTGTNADSILTYSYDDLGRIESATLNGKTIGYDYDATGNRTFMTTPEGETIQYTYDRNQMSRMQLLSNSKGMDYTYNALNRIVRKDYSGGSYSTYGFDDAGRLENISHLRSDDSEIYTQDNTPDKVGNIISKNTGIGITTYDYDDTYQLTNAIHPTQPQEDFTYDPVGNRLTSTDYSDWGYNVRNQLAGYNGSAFIYDSNGNTIAKMDTTGTTGYTYNYANRLTRVDFPGGGYAEYKYDVRGRRIEKNINGTITKYLYDGDLLIAEYDASDILQRNYFYGAGDINPSILYEESNVYFFHHDHLNTPQVITDESGTIVWETEYKSFGETTITTETVSNNFRFPGQYYDQESGLHYNYFRCYDPNTGRYLREDPIGLYGGINPYTYVNNNPLIYIDLNGLKGFSFVMGPGGGVGYVIVGGGLLYGEITDNDSGEICMYTVSALGIGVGLPDINVMSEPITFSVGDPCAKCSDFEGNGYIGGASVIIGGGLTIGGGIKIPNGPFISGDLLGWGEGGVHIGVSHSWAYFDYVGSR